MNPTRGEFTRNLVNVVCKMRIFAPISWNLRKIYAKYLRISRKSRKFAVEKEIKANNNNRQPLKKLKIMTRKNLTATNDVQTKVAAMINELCKDVIGEYEITLDSKPENSDEWKAAKEALDDPDFLYEEIVNKFRAGYSGWLKKGNENTHFVSLLWVRTKIAERINYYLS